RLKVTLGAGAGNLDVAATYDPATKCYFLFSSNPGSNVDFTLDISALNLPASQPVMLEEVSETSWGGVRNFGAFTNNQITITNHGPNTVWLFTMPAKPVGSLQTLTATDDAMVHDGTNKSVNFGPSPVCWVKNSSTTASDRSVTFIKFHLPLIYHGDIQLAT